MNTATKCNKMQHPLTPKQQLAVGLLVTGMSNVDVAKELDVNRGTILRWRNKEAFQRELNVQLAEIFAASLQRLRGTIVPMAIAELEARLHPDCDYSAFPTSQILQLVKMFGSNLPPEVKMVSDSSFEQDMAPQVSQEIKPPSDLQMLPKTKGIAS